MSPFLCDDHPSIALTVLTPSTWQTMDLSPAERAWATQQGFEGKAKQYCALPDGQGGTVRILVGAMATAWDLGGYASLVPPGHYHFEADLTEEALTQAALSWALEQYRFDRYLQDTAPAPRVLVLPKTCDLAALQDTHAATCWIRDLINTPTNDMGPEALAEAACQLARDHQATCRVVVGDALNTEGFPGVYQVGQAASQAPRLIEIDWCGDAKGPSLTLVGKGVCFDTGGLDIKTAAGMLSMKKDMGGGAHALGLAKKIMLAQLPIRLKVLVPAVENSIAGNAYRPSDILTMRNGSTVEVTNTDAEGRLIMADVLHYACEHTPDLLIDFATLTGAARVALGTEIVALFSNCDALAHATVAQGARHHDPIWHLPLYQRYRHLLETPIATCCNAARSGYGGAITAALFLEAFVDHNVPWLHCDLMAANTRKTPGRPKGGEAMGLRAFYAMLQQWCIDPSAYTVTPQQNDALTMKG